MDDANAVVAQAQAELDQIQKQPFTMNLSAASERKHYAEMDGQRFPLKRFLNGRRRKQKEWCLKWAARLATLNHEIGMLDTDCPLPSVFIREKEEAPPLDQDEAIDRGVPWVPPGSGDVLGNVKSTNDRLGREIDLERSSDPMNYCPICGGELWGDHVCSKR